MVVDKFGVEIEVVDKEVVGTEAEDKVVAEDSFGWPGKPRYKFR